MAPTGQKKEPSQPMLSSREYPFGSDMIEWMHSMWSHPRSITGSGVRATIGCLKTIVPGLRHHSVASGTQIFDWTVPDEYLIREAYIKDAKGNKVVDFRDNNLHVVGYSSPVRSLVSLGELDKHLHSIPEIPDAIPYITSYYKDRWGFCIQHNKREKLEDGMYEVVIDSEKFPGKMDYADIIIPGRTEEEILISSYICHPMMANDSLSGVVMAAALARWLMSQNHVRHTYRIVFVPETIGALAYIHANLDALRRNVKAGYVLTCCGDEGPLSYLHSRNGGTLADIAATSVLASFEHKEYLYTDRGSDERQYCWPGIDLPVGSIMKSKYGEYPEYHTSKDDFSLVTERGLEETFHFLRRLIITLEANRTYKAKTIGEPFLTGRGIQYPEGHMLSTPDILNILAYCDGSNDIFSIAAKTGIDAWFVFQNITFLFLSDLIE